MTGNFTILSSPEDRLLFQRDVPPFFFFKNMEFSRCFHISLFFLQPEEIVEKESENFLAGFVQFSEKFIFFNQRKFPEVFAQG